MGVTNNEVLHLREQYLTDNKRMSFNTETYQLNHFKFPKEAVKQYELMYKHVSKGSQVAKIFV